MISLPVNKTAELPMGSVMSGDTKTDPPGDTKTDPFLHT